MKRAIFQLLLTVLIIPVVWSVLYVMGTTGLYNPEQTPRAITILAITVPAFLLVCLTIATIRSMSGEPPRRVRVLHWITLGLIAAAAVVLIFAAISAKA